MSSQGIFSLVYLIVVVLLMIYAIAGTLFQHKHIHIIHQTGLGIVIGWCIGGLIFLKYQGSREILEFNQNIFFFALLPAIIFSGGYNLKKTGLFKNFNYISIYGIIGTLVAFFVILGLTIMINNLDLIRQFSDIKQVVHLSTSTILLYSATICATDSVAALTMIKAQKYPKLFSIIFGEGMVNDAVAIILFRSVFDLFGGQHVQSIGFGTIMQIFKSFVLNLIFSLLIGIGSGLICTFIFKKLRFLTVNPVIEVVLSYLFGIFSYALAQLFDFSGVIAVLVSAIVMAHFNFYNLSPTGQLSTGVTFQTISFFAESFLFVYLGMSFWNYVSTENHRYSWSWTFVALELAICTIARFASVFILSGVFYLFMKKKWKVGLYQLGIIWFAGIIRGSVAFALILTVPNGDNQTRQGIQIIKSSVLIIVFITTIILGGFMPSYITCSLNRAAARQQNQKNNEIEEGTSTNQTQPLVEKPKKKNFFSKFDQQYFKPWFIYNYHQRKDQIKKFKKLLKINSAEFKGGQFIALMNTNSVAVHNQSVIIQDKKESLLDSQHTNDQRNTLA